MTKPKRDIFFYEEYNLQKMSLVNFGFVKGLCLLGAFLGFLFKRGSSTNEVIIVKNKNMVGW